MQTKLLNEIIAEIAGKQAEDLINLLFGKNDVNEFLIAKKLKLTINQVRNILCRLSNFNLVSFIRKKDKRKGWYTYFWTVEIKKALELLDERLAKHIESLKNQLKNREIKRFYFCKTCKTEVGEESALLNNFLCHECGETYELADNKKIISDLEKNILRLERQRQNVFVELEKIKADEAKKSVKSQKKKTAKIKKKVAKIKKKTAKIKKKQQKIKKKSRKKKK